VLALSATGGERDQGERNDARVLGSDHTVILSFREACMAVDLRWTSHSALDWIRPMWAERKLAHDFALICDIYAGLAGSDLVSRPGIFGVLGRILCEFGSGQFRSLDQKLLKLFI
jgi:hypothetical protein